MSSQQNIEISIYNFFDFLINYKYIILSSILFPLIVSITYYFFQPKTFEYQVDLITNNKLNFQSEEFVSIQNINTNYQILKSINISRDLLIRMTENINPSGIISKYNYFMTIEDIILSEEEIYKKFKNLKSIKVLEKKANLITLEFKFFEINNSNKEIHKITEFLNNQTLNNLSTSFDRVNQQFRKFIKISNFGSVKDTEEITNDLLFSEIDQVIDKYHIFNNENNFFIDEKQTKIRLISKVNFKISFIILIPILSFFLMITYLFIRELFQSYFFYKSGK